MDITKEWANTQNKKGSVTNRQFYTVDNVKYNVDGKHVILEPSDKEKFIASILCDKYGKDVELLPHVSYPPNIQTPDYLINGQRYDLKSIMGSGKDMLRDILKKKKKQAPNFILDITNCPLPIENLIQQIKGIYTSNRTKFVNTIVLFRDDSVIAVYNRQ